ncbi:type VII secretion protein EccE [Hoyosella subflava]|uniref:Type VII secretion system protein EccE domain-containing protein n=1 Tax=Hoyosella subflava (strain DSM 45089 / JCM 17490 / NBRC 109087 / DQS3-9A1) TaxID=443218 RepID=F6EIN2_HOYSD|nr:type VII secretion protein EccE [Hoyosella subflava]AEF38957.1 hypothetical protein AS9A_0500 [Hoyosella subflava DQS3-9A1]
MDVHIARVLQRVPIRGMVAAQIAVLWAIVTGTIVKLPSVTMVSGAVLLAILCLATWRGRLLIDWAAAPLTAHAKAYAEDPDPIGRVFSVPLSQVTGIEAPGATAIGIHCRGTSSAAILEITSAPLMPAAFGRDSYAGETAVPMRALSKLLDQYGFALSGIDVVTHGLKSTTDHPIGQHYARLIAPLPAASHRRTWIVLRLDTLDSWREIQRRGGGDAGIGQALAVTAVRAQRQLASEGFGTTPLTAADIERIGRSAPRFDRIYALGAPGLSPEQMLPVWQPATSLTALTLQLRRVRENANCTEARYGVAAVAGHASAPDVKRTPIPVAHAVPLSGHGDLVHQILLPLGSGDAATMSGTLGRARFPADKLPSLHIPAGGCGQLIGTDQMGRAITIPLASSSVRYAMVAGRIQLVQQVVIRAVAAGAHVRIATNRPHVWAPLIPNRRLTQKPGIIAFAEQPWVAPATETHRLLVVDDPDYHLARQPGITILEVRGMPVDGTAHDREVDSPRPEADVTIEQSRHAASQLRVTIGGRHLDLSIVTYPEEMDYLTHPGSTGRTISSQPESEGPRARRVHAHAG